MARGPLPDLSATLNTNPAVQARLRAFLATPQGQFESQRGHNLLPFISDVLAQQGIQVPPNVVITGGAGRPVQAVDAGSAAGNLARGAATAGAVVGGGLALGALGGGAAAAAPAASDSGFVASDVANTANAATAGMGAAGGAGFVGDAVSQTAKNALKGTQPGLFSRIAEAGLGIGQTLAGMEQGRATGRVDENNVANQQDASNLQRTLAQRQDYQRNVGNWLHGDLLKGIQDVTVAPPPGVAMGTITGGLRPSAVPDRAALGDQLTRTALMNLMNDNTALPAPAPRPQATGVDTGLNIASPILAGLPFLSPDALRRLTQPPGGSVRYPV